MFVSVSFVKLLYINFFYHSFSIDCKLKTYDTSSLSEWQRFLFCSEKLWKLRKNNVSTFEHFSKLSITVASFLRLKMFFLWWYYIFDVWYIMIEYWKEIELLNSDYVWLLILILKIFKRKVIGFNVKVNK